MKIGDTIYVRKKLTENDSYIEYSNPIPIKTRLMYLTIMPNKGEMKTEINGTESNADWIGIAYRQCFKDYFAEGDLFYIDGANPNDENSIGDNANGIIVSVREFNLTYRLIIKER